VALKAAIDIDLFTAIGEGANTVPSLANRCHASDRGVRILCDFLTVLGFLTKTDQRYQLGADTALFLDKRSPAYIGSIADFMLARERLSRFADFTEIVRRGGPAEATVSDSAEWVLFARSMAPLMAMLSQRLADLLAVKNAGRLRVLDVAAGHGLFGIAVAKANPQAEITALDGKPVLAVASENAAKAGVADRHHTIAGDVLTVDLGGPYDLALITNFIHIFRRSHVCRVLETRPRRARSKRPHRDCRLGPGREPRDAASAGGVRRLDADGDEGRRCVPVQRVSGDARRCRIPARDAPRTAADAAAGGNRGQCLTPTSSAAAYPSAS
jgi:methyltransferase family protein